MPSPTSIVPHTPVGGRNDSEAVGPTASNKSLQTWLAARGAGEVFRQFQDLTVEVFPQGTEFAFALEADPDAEEDSVVCVATLPHGHPVKALSYYDQFVAKWSRLADPKLSGLFTLLVR